MSRTVSFRASEELDEFLEKEAERRMTTKSTVANMLIAERVRELQSEEETEELDSKAVASTVDEDGDEDIEGGGLPGIFERHSDRWYVPDSEKDYKFAVRGDQEHRRKYYKTQRGAAKRLREVYE